MKFSVIGDVSSIGVSRILEAVINGIFWFILADWLSKSDYGEITYLVSISMMGFGLCGLGLDKLLVVYGAKKENVLFPTFVLGLSSTIISALVVFVVTNNVAVSLLVIGLTIFNLHVNNLLSVPKYRLYSIFFLARRSLTTVFGLALYPLLGIEGIILGFILGTLPSAPGFYNFLKKPRANISAVLKSRTKFIVQNYAIVLVSTFRGSGIKLLVGILFGFALLGEFQLASQYLLVIGILPAVLATYLLPQEAKGKSNRNLKICSILISLILAILSVIFLPWGVTNILPKYASIIFPMQIMSISIIPQVIATILENDFLGREKSRLVLLSTIINTLVFMILMIFLGNAMGMEGIAYAFVLGNVAWCCSYAIFKFYRFS
jgi:O-antigen/teichoic acid export membrane protein